MKVFVSVDMEGIGGIASWREMRTSSPDHNMVRSLATEEVNAVTRGLKASGVDHVVVCDSHALGENLYVEQLDPDVELVRGYPRAYYMLHGLDASFGLLILLGYHARCGTMHGVLDHSYSSFAIYNMKLNGKDVGELEINSGLAATYGVPVGLVSGDAELIEQVKSTLPQHVETVVTKYGISRMAARSRHPEKIREELERKARKAVEKVGRLGLLTYQAPLRVELDLMDSVMADMVALLPFVERRSARQVVFETDDFAMLYRELMAVIALCTSTREWR